MKDMAFTTKKSLLRKVRAGDEISWNEFYQTYFVPARELVIRKSTTSSY